MILLTNVLQFGFLYTIDLILLVDYAALQSKLNARR